MPLILLTGLSTDVFEQHLGGGSAAVDGDGCTGDVAGLLRGKEGDHFGYLLGLGGAIQKGRTSQLLGSIRCSPAREHGTRRNGVYANTPGAELRRPSTSQRSLGCLGRPVGCSSSQPD